MMGFGALLLGHNNRDIALEVIKQLESGSMLGVTSELFIDYLAAVQKAVPSMRKMRLCNSGTEAKMHAIRTARAYSGREKIAKAEGAYHGAHDYVLQSLDMDPRMARNNGYKPVPYGRGIPKAVSDTVVIYPYNDIEGTAAILEENEDEVGTLIVEPVLCGPAVIVPKGNYLKRLRQLTRKRTIVASRPGSNTSGRSGTCTSPQRTRSGTSATRSARTPGAGGTGSSIASGTTSCSASRTPANERSSPRSTRTRTSSGPSKSPTAHSPPSRRKRTAIVKRRPRSSFRRPASRRPWTVRRPRRVCDVAIDCLSGSSASPRRSR